MSEWIQALELVVKAGIAVFIAYVLYRICVKQGWI